MNFAGLSGSWNALSAGKNRGLRSLCCSMHERRWLADCICSPLSATAKQQAECCCIQPLQHVLLLRTCTPAGDYGLGFLSLLEGPSLMPFPNPKTLSKSYSVIHPLQVTMAYAP